MNQLFSIYSTLNRYSLKKFEFGGGGMGRGGDKKTIKEMLPLSIQKKKKQDKTNKAIAHMTFTMKKMDSSKYR